MTVVFAQKRSNAGSVYETDFHRWVDQQARSVREGHGTAIDWENVAEEIESLGRRDRHALGNHLEILIAHLLTCIVQPERRTASWYSTIREQRKQILQLIQRNPSLKTLPKRRYGVRYEAAVRRAVRDTGIAEDTFPKSSPFTIEDVLDAGFLPGSREGKVR